MSRGRKLVIGVIVVVVVGFLVLQLVPVAGRENPPVYSQIAWNSPDTETLVRSACYDCHSNETQWPWYAQIAPVSWSIAAHVRDGREALNFSEETANQISPEELVEEIQEGEMPVLSYVMLHPEAKLNAEQTETLIAGFRASLFGTEDDDEGHEAESGETDDDD